VAPKEQKLKETQENLTKIESNLEDKLNKLAAIKE
jgi:hypothetical protein